MSKKELKAKKEALEAELGTEAYFATMVKDFGFKRVEVPTLPPPPKRKQPATGK